jgi:hypothetical protein
VSAASGRAKLASSLRDLKIHWDKTKTKWNDPMSRKLEEEFLGPLEPTVKSALLAITSMAELLARAQRECR